MISGNEKGQKDTVYVCVGDFYNGELKNNKREGSGTYRFACGTIYEGEWKNDKREGKGIEKYVLMNLFTMANGKMATWKEEEHTNLLLEMFA